MALPLVARQRALLIDGKRAGCAFVELDGARSAPDPAFHTLSVPSAPTETIQRPWSSAAIAVTAPLCATMRAAGAKSARLARDDIGAAAFHARQPVLVGHRQAGDAEPDQQLVEERAPAPRRHAPAAHATRPRWRATREHRRRRTLDALRYGGDGLASRPPEALRRPVSEPELRARLLTHRSGTGGRCRCGLGRRRSLWRRTPGGVSSSLR